MEKTIWNQDYEKTLEQLACVDEGLREKTRRRQLKTQWFRNLAERQPKRTVQTPRTLTTPKLRLKITTFTNLEFQNRDFWIRPTDLSKHFPFLVTIRELPFKKFPRKVTREVESQERQDRGSRPGIFLFL